MERNGRDTRHDMEKLADLIRGRAEVVAEDAKALGVWMSPRAPE